MMKGFAKKKTQKKIFVIEYILIIFVILKTQIKSDFGSMSSNFLKQA